MLSKYWRGSTKKQIALFWGNQTWLYHETIDDVRSFRIPLFGALTACCTELLWLNLVDSPSMHIGEPGLLKYFSTESEYLWISRCGMSWAAFLWKNTNIPKKITNYLKPPSYMNRKHMKIKPLKLLLFESIWMTYQGFKFPIKEKSFPFPWGVICAPSPWILTLNCLLDTELGGKP